MQSTQELVIQKYNAVFPAVSKADEAIELMKANFLPLVVKDHQDKAGFDAVHQARMIVKAKRVEVEKVRKELKADALAYTKAVDGEARRITMAIEEVENHLIKQEDVVIGHAARLAAEQARQEEEARRADAARLLSENARLDEEVRKMALERAALEAEKAAVAKAKSDAEAAERKRLADIEYEKKASQIRAENEARRVQEEANRIAQAEARAKAEAERAFKAAQEAKAAAERAKAEAEARREAARKRKEANAPDREKLLKFSDSLRMIIIMPDCKGGEGQQLVADIQVEIIRLANGIKAKAESI